MFVFGGGFGGGGGGNRGGGGAGINLSPSGTSTGLIKPFSTGINYTDDWGAKIKITGSYFYSHTNTIQQQDMQRVTTYGDSIVTKNSTTYSNNTNENHRINLRVEYQIDSMNSILYTPSLTFQHSNNLSNNTSSSFSKTPTIPEFLAINTQSRNTNARHGYNMGNNFLLRHKFRKIGRTITLGLNNTMGDSKSNGFTYSDNEFFLPSGALYRSQLQDQENHQETTTRNNVL